MIKIIIGVIIILLILGFIFVFNKIISYEQRVKKAFYDIDIALKYSIETIKNLVNIVKASYGKESEFYKQIYEIFIKISENYKEYVRNLTANPNKSIENAQNIVNAVYPIILQLPQFPQIPNAKFPEEFKKIHDDLRVAMERIMYARQFYNQAVQDYNTLINSIPYLFIARLLGKREYNYWQLENREEIERNIQDLTKDLL